MPTTNFHRAGLAVFLLIVLAWYALTRSLVPAASMVNGTYSNPCCDNFILRDGVIIVGKTRVPFELKNMKFGLTAYPRQQVLVEAHRVEIRDEADPGALLFSEKGTVLTVCGDRLCNQTFRFKRR
jgi:hypothetical protein